MEKLDDLSTALVELNESEQLSTQGGCLPLIIFGASLLAGAYYLGKDIGRAW